MHRIQYWRTKNAIIQVALASGTAEKRENESRAEKESTSRMDDTYARNVREATDGAE